MTNERYEAWNTVAKILLRSTLLGFALMLLWLGAYFLANDLLLRQAAMFDLTPHEVGVVTYGGLGFVKMCVLLFFFFPYVAIRLVVRRPSA